MSAGIPETTMTGHFLRGYFMGLVYLLARGSLGHDMQALMFDRTPFRSVQMLIVIV